MMLDIRVTQNESFMSGSHLDFFLASPLLVNYLTSSEIELAFQSDHSPVSTLFLLHRNPKGKGMFRFPEFLVSDDKYSDILSETIQDVVKTVHSDAPVESRPNPALLWDTVKAAI